MKYLTYWGMADNPFSKEIPAKSLLKTGDMLQASGCLDFVVKNGGVGILTGQPGQGKTTIIRSIIEGLQVGLYKTSYVQLSTVSVGEYYKVLARGLGIEPASRKIENFRNIQRRIKDLKTKDRIMPIVICDEAQYLTRDTLLDLPLLMNFDLDSHDYAGLILCGTPALNERLNMQAFDALRDRIVANYDLKGISEEEARDYITERIRRVSGNPGIFQEAAVFAAHSAAKGSLRRLNNILTKALMIGCTQELTEIDAQVIQSAVDVVQL